jgi:hypothetical protein
VTYAIEFLCLSVAKLMVLDRMTDFACQGDGMSRRWVVGGRVVMAAVVAGQCGGLGGNVAAAVYFERLPSFTVQHLPRSPPTTLPTATTSSTWGSKDHQLANSTQSLQSFCEVAVLLLIIVAFAVVGAASARRVSSALLDMNDAASAAAGRQLRRQIVGTAAFVFVTFLLRAVFSTMFALANELQNGVMLRAVQAKPL